ncbi:MAG: mechanosensitive ion channel family protein [Nanoarchaeota archaeon]
MALFQRLVDFVKGLVMPLLNNVVIAVFTFFIGLIIGRIFGKLVHRVLHAFDVDKTLVKAIGAKVSVEGFTEILVSYVIYVVFLLFALNQIGLTQWVLYLIAGIACIVALIAAFLALKDLVPNAVAGYFIMRREFPKVGDLIKVDDVVGKVSNINMLETRVKTKKGDVISYPNSRLLRSKLEKVVK